MSEKQRTENTHPIDRLGFALLMSIVAAVGLGLGTGNIGLAIAVGFAVFLIFGLELSER